MKFQWLVYRIYNVGQNILIPFHVLAFHSTGETELDYYHHKVNVKVASQNVERSKTSDVRKLDNFQKNPKKIPKNRL